ncbi:MAG: HEAT repeat domain-containing protein [Planctomycetes bacterium]|nr:HEAT repeat domain-containing protein [Planctomycetota bacterium]
MSTPFRCPHCCIPLSNAPRSSAEPDAASDEVDRLASSHFYTRRWVVSQLVAGLLAGVAGVVVCVWAVERSAPGSGSKKIVATAVADARAGETAPGSAEQGVASQGPTSLKSAGQLEVQPLSAKAISRPPPGGAKAIAPPLQGPAAKRSAARPRATGPAPNAAAPPEPPRPAEQPVARLALKRLQRLDEDDLRAELRRVPEVALDTVPNTSKRVFVTVNQLLEQGGRYDGPASLQSKRPDLAGLPLRQGKACQLAKDEAKEFQDLSRKLHEHLGKSDPAALRQALLETEKETWLTPNAIPVMTQILQAENSSVRLLYAEVLGRIRGGEAAEALVRRAVLDLAPEVRERAIRELRTRSRNDYVPLLLRKLRYPWAPAAGHAAEALVALDLKETVLDLVRMLGEPDPTLPTTVTEGRTRYQVVPELVRVNHLRNCALCHPPSFSKKDLIRATFRALSPAEESPAFIGYGGGQGEDPGPFVRADITYLRQDFSVMHQVEDHEKAPPHQRFDYVVRQRLLTPVQAAELLQRRQKGRSTQREAVLFALRELTGKNLGPRAENWLRGLWPEKQPKPDGKQR